MVKSSGGSDKNKSHTRAQNHGKKRSAKTGKVTWHLQQRCSNRFWVESGPAWLQSPLGSIWDVSKGAVHMIFQNLSKLLYLIKIWYSQVKRKSWWVCTCTNAQNLCKCLQYVDVYGEDKGTTALANIHGENMYHRPNQGCFDRRTNQSCNPSRLHSLQDARKV